jgi:phosphatidylserine/phosphatidylglycerophosphate/cardiolipin synthase-like enzyme
MAKFLNGPGVQAALIDIINHSEKNLWLISPYLKIPIQTQNYLKSIDKKGVTIVIIYRKDKNNYPGDQDLAFFKGLKHLDLRNCENLHTKCYLNDKEGLITSMNLHEYSQTHNWEMGIYFSKQGDPLIYNDVIRELQALGTHAKKPNNEKGFCIRCGHLMDTFDPARPLCNKCFSSWARYKNKRYAEKFCHSCGSDTTKSHLSFEQPLCMNCTNNLKK